jgi:TorA maturation chaperone TorD
MNNKSATQETLQSTAGIYRILAQLYRRELTPALASELQDAGFWDGLERGGYAIEKDKLSDDEFIRSLAIEYSKIFIGPAGHLAPYGSVHHPDDPKKGSLWGDTTIWVRRFVLDHGLKFEGKSYDGIPDHISHEFEFLSHLLKKEAALREEGRTEKADEILYAEQLFFKEQVAKWIPSFSGKVQKKATLKFYGEVARLTADIVELEKERLGLAEEAA